MTSIVALIPARAGSKRIVGKNTRELAGHPLIAYTIAAAKQSDVFDNIIVCTDSAELGVLVDDAYDTAVFMRQPSGDGEPDIYWVAQVLRDLKPSEDAFAILRPTSPFRTAETIYRAYFSFLDWSEHSDFDSMRAVEPCGQHPGKMWTRAAVNGFMSPLLLQPTATPWHSRPTQTLPKVWVQNASLEIAWTETVERTGTIAGDRILAFETHGHEGLDINTERDWVWAEHLIATGQAKLPEIA